MQFTEFWFTWIVSVMSSDPPAVKSWHIFAQIKFQWYRCKSGNVIFAWGVTWNNACTFPYFVCNIYNIYYLVIYLPIYPQLKVYVENVNYETDQGFSLVWNFNCLQLDIKIHLTIDVYVNKDRENQKISVIL